MVNAYSYSYPGYAYPYPQYYQTYPGYGSTYPGVYPYMQGYPQAVTFFFHIFIKMF